jgi:hypothetical protein
VAGLIQQKCFDEAGTTHQRLKNKLIARVEADAAESGHHLKDVVPYISAL